MFWTITKAYKPSQTLRWKGKHAWRKFKVLIPLPTFCLLSYARTEAFGIFVRDGSYVSLHRRNSFPWETSWMAAGNFGISNPKREAHTAVVNRKINTQKTRHANFASKSNFLSHGTQVSNYQSSGNFLSRQRIEGHLRWWISYKGIGCLNYDFAMISLWFQGLLLEVLLEHTRTAIFWLLCRCPRVCICSTQCKATASESRRGVAERPITRDWWCCWCMLMSILRFPDK